jgi:hypothetical protein
MNKSSSTLINVLIGKAIVETLLVGAIAVGFYASAFPPTFHGWGEIVGASQSIAGWAVNSAAPWERVEVQLFVDDRFVGTQAANLSRPDLVVTGWSKDEWHGYNFKLSDLAPGHHEARVYVLRQSGGGVRYTLQLLGDPIGFVVNARSGE